MSDVEMRRLHWLNGLVQCLFPCDNLSKGVTDNGYSNGGGGGRFRNGMY
jgi:hypothetical protein